MKIIAFILYLLCISFTMKAQDKSAPEESSGAIEDNSFIIEEAYNQEERVVQHISQVYYRSEPSKDVMYSFTQEWPLFKYKQQISYTIPYSFIDGNSIKGIGDILINYRYQIFYKENWACFAPRLSLVLPVGDYKKGLGFGAFGIQVNLPVSKRLSDFWVVHVNAGSTVFPNAKGLTMDNEEIRKTLSFYNIGGSIIWLTRPVFNVMLECIENFNSEINLNGDVEHSSEIIINPGIRGAVNLGKLQIVPGVSFPLFIGSHEVNPGFLFYLSFEHPY
jgi:hypothetical protein